MRNTVTAARGSRVRAPVFWTAGQSSTTPRRKPAPLRMSPSNSRRSVRMSGHPDHDSSRILKKS